jgi:hypothetical protein
MKKLVFKIVGFICTPCMYPRVKKTALFDFTL